MTSGTMLVLQDSERVQPIPNAIHSASKHTGIATKISTTECCFTNATDIHTKKQKITMNVLHHVDADFSFSQVEAIPIEYATCKDGQTFVLVSNVYNSPTISVKILSLTNSSGLKSCRFGKII